MSSPNHVSGGMSSSRRKMIGCCLKIFNGCQSCLDFLIWVIGPILSVCAVGLISLCVYTFFSELVPDYPAATAFPLIVMGLSILFNIFFNYFRCMFVGPGFAPPSLPDHVLERLAQDPDLTVDQKNRRMCKKCNIVKPMRAHHCSVCKKCVLKMDHHCPWMNSCIGHYNIRYFFLFLVWLWIGALFFALVGLPHFLQVIRGQRATTGFVFCELLAIGIFATMTGFIAWNTYLLLTNQTTIEFYGNKFEKNKRWKVMGLLNPLNLGWKRNFQEVFGECTWYSWLLPSLRPPPGDGYVFPLQMRPDPKAQNTQVELSPV